MKRMLSLLISLLLIFSLLSGVLLAANNVSYIDENGIEQTVATAIDLTSSSTSWGSSASTTWYSVTGNLTINSSVTVSGDVHLILTDGSSLTVAADKNTAILIPENCSLSIYGQILGTGILMATGEGTGAGIGSDAAGAGGLVKINGGTITAKGGKKEVDERYIGGPGIGGGSNVFINGGDIKANGYGKAAGIGSGENMPTGIQVVITGGKVYATGGSEGGAAIGGAGGKAASRCDGGEVTISGGEVTVLNMMQNYAGAGIGGGAFNSDARVTISGGIINATVGYSPGNVTAAGIGCGERGIACSVTITGGEIIADGGEGTGIGAGVASTNTNGLVNISGGVITARGGSYAGIGGHGMAVTITGGKITATGGIGGGVGIGSGAMGTGETVTISGGEILAHGIEGAGIGVGRQGNGGIVTITGGEIGASSEMGAGIGAGFRGNCGRVEITGGTITAIGLNDKGAGIGTGATNLTETLDPGNIYIAGGNVLAQGYCAIGVGEGAANAGEVTAKNFAGGEDVFLNTITLNGADPNLAITKLTTDIGYSYGTNDLKAFGTTLYIYLPERAYLIEARTPFIRYIGQSEAGMVVSFSPIGEDGREVELKLDGLYIMWRYQGEATWKILVALADITGADGKDGIDGINGSDGIDGLPGRDVNLRVADGYIQWQHQGEATWQNLVLLADLTGAKGADGQQGKDGADGTDGREIELRLNQGYIQWHYKGEENWQDLVALSAITGPKGIDGQLGSDGREVLLQYEGGYIQWRYEDETAWQNLLQITNLSAPSGADGADGREIELKVEGDFIQWRYLEDPSWRDLISLASITGPPGSKGQAGKDGREIELNTTGDYVQWRYLGDLEWQNLILLADLIGPAGADGSKGKDGLDGKAGREIELRQESGFVEWRYLGDVDWQKLISLADITGQAGTDGTNGQDGLAGIDGREIELQQAEGFIQWRYLGDSSWQNLLALADITGAAGKDGKDGKDGQDGQDGQRGDQGAEGKAGKDGKPGEKGADGLSGINGIDGRDGVDGKDGKDGSAGKDGRGIVNVLKSGSDKNIDIYTISFTDDTEIDFTVTNGQDGAAVSEAILNENKEIILTLTDGRKLYIGQLDAEDLVNLDNAVPIDTDNGNTTASVAIVVSIAVLLSHLGWLIPMILRKRLIT